MMMSEALPLKVQVAVALLIVKLILGKYCCGPVLVVWKLPMILSHCEILRREQAEVHEQEGVRKKKAGDEESVPTE